ncbi:uncharacterized protein LOC141856553 [Brevipalpus obovatus]|uniref:uncharacterized protein LOC141856553 n=1 Tax=Brevipalpus obovatus TaxID=246614 RepID=UPI003D9DB29F
MSQPLFDKISSISECIGTFNRLVIEKGLPIPRIRSLKNLDSNAFFILLEKILEMPLLDIRNSSLTEVKKFQILISILSEKILKVKLDHIIAQDLAERKLKPMINLVEIFLALDRLMSRNSNSIEPEPFSSALPLHKTSSLSSLISSSSTSLIMSSSGSTTSLISFPSSSDLEIYNPQKSPPSTRKPIKNISKHTDRLDPESKSGKKLYRNRSLSAPNIMPASSGASVKEHAQLLQSDINRRIERDILPCIGEENAHRMALELGYKLQKTLRLEDMLRKIENKIAIIRGDLPPHPIKEGVKKTGKKKSSLKRPSFKIPNHPTKSSGQKKSSNMVKVERPLTGHSCILNVSNFGRKQPSKVIERSSCHTDHPARIIDGCERANVHNSKKLQKIKERSDIRNARSERAHLYKVVNDLERKVCSRFLAAESQLYNLTKCRADDEYQLLKQITQDIRRKVKDKCEIEKKQQELVLDSLRNTFRQEYDLLMTKHGEREKNLSSRYKSRATLLVQLNQQLNNYLSSKLSHISISKN